LLFIVFSFGYIYLKFIKHKKAPRILATIFLSLFPALTAGMLNASANALLSAAGVTLPIVNITPGASVNQFIAGVDSAIEKAAAAVSLQIESSLGTEEQSGTNDAQSDDVSAGSTVGTDESGHSGVFDYNAGSSTLIESDAYKEDVEVEVFLENAIPILPDPHEEDRQISNLVMADVRDSLNVRELPFEEAPIVGKLYKDCGGEILEKKDGWTKLKSGDLVGWAKDDYLLFGDDATQLAEEVGTMVAVVKTDTLRVRGEPSTSGKVWGLLFLNDEIPIVSSYFSESVEIESGSDSNADSTADKTFQESQVPANDGSSALETDADGDLDESPGNGSIGASEEETLTPMFVTGGASQVTSAKSLSNNKALDDYAAGASFKNEVDDWVMVDFEGGVGYVAAEFVEISFHIDKGETLEQITQRERLEAIEKAKLNKQLNKNLASDVSDLDLLAAIIQCEAGNQPAEGKLAVGAVVMNRVISSAYPNTIYGVIFASGQFSPATGTRMATILKNGANASCVEAARQALAGVTNIGNLTHFKRKGTVAGIEIGDHVFY